MCPASCNKFWVQVVMAPMIFIVTPSTHIFIDSFVLITAHKALENVWLVLHVPSFESAMKLEAYIQTVLVFGCEVWSHVFGVTDMLF
jgi:hypothetical protein